MKHLNPVFEMEDLPLDLEFEAQVLEKCNRTVELLNKKGYKIKKPIWNGLIAS